jgi:hypothetical protein
MTQTTFFVYIALYIYGFSLMIWALFFDRNPTKKTRIASLLGLTVLSLTLFYFFYVILTIGITP